jgi:Ca2+-binding EF-hand superfamily protein
MKKTVLLITGVAVIAGSAIAAEKAPGWFKKNDKDKDGLLNKEEFIAARIDGTKDWYVKEGKGLDAWKEKFPEPEKQFGEDFAKWDSNSDGSIDVEEFLNKGKKKK